MNKNPTLISSGRGPTFVLVYLSTSFNHKHYEMLFYLFPEPRMILAAFVSYFNNLILLMICILVRESHLLVTVLIFL